MHRPVYRSILALGFFLIAGNGWAGPVTGTITATLGNPVNQGDPQLIINDGSGSAPTTTYNYSGYIPWTLNSNTNPTGIPIPSTFNTFCVELTQNVNIGSQYTFKVTSDLSSAPINPSNPSGAAGMGATRADAISRLWNRYNTGSLNTVDAAALQLAIWRIEYDGVGSTVTDFSSGNFRVKAPSTGPNIADSTAAINEAVTEYNYISSSLSHGTDSHTLFALESLNAQDQVTFVSVNIPNISTPEPSTLCLGLMGGLAFTAIQYRRRKNARASA